MSQSSDFEDLYPVAYRAHKSLHRAYLFDVDGYVVRGDFNEPVNLYHPAIKDYIADGKIRFIYDVSKEYRYIIVSSEQYKRFQRERVMGSKLRSKLYHIYPDHDSTTVPLLTPRPKRPNHS